MNSEKLLEDLESIVVNASKMPFTNKKVVDEEELLSIVDELKGAMPDEVEQARKVLAERDKIIADAQRHADSMVAQAKDYIAKLTEESEIVRQSQEHANHSSEDLRNSSVTYAGQVLQYVESTLEKTLASVRQNREGLVQSNRQESNK